MPPETSPAAPPPPAAPAMPPPTPTAATPPVTPPAAPPGAATPPAGDAPAPEGGKEPSWLKERLERERRTAMKALGFDTPEAAQAAIARAKDLETAAEVARLAQLSDLEREKERASKAERELATERARATKLEQQGQLSAACAELGLKNTSYAGFLFEQARQADPNITADAALKAAIADETQRAALGAAPVPTRQVPAGGATPPGTPPSPGAQGQGQTFDASKATADEWQTYKRSIGLPV